MKESANAYVCHAGEGWTIGCGHPATAMYTSPTVSTYTVLKVR